MSQILLIVLSIIRILYVATYSRGAESIKWLPYEYHSRAVSFLSGHPISYPDAWGSFYIILAGFYKLIDGLGFSSTRITIFALFQAILGCLSVYIFFLLAKKLFSQKIAVFGSIIFALYYPLIYLHTLILSESVYTFLLLLFAYTVIRDKFKAKHHILIGLLAGLLVITRPIFLAFIPFFALWYIFRIFGKRKKDLYLMILALLIFIEIIFSTAIINYIIGKQKQFSFGGNMAVNMVMNWCKIKKLQYRLTTGEKHWFSPPAYWNSPNLKERTTNISFYDQKYYLQTAFNCLSQNPKYLVENFGNIIRLYNSIFYPEIYPPVWHKYFISFWKGISVVFTLLFFIFPLLFSKKEKKYYWFFFFLLISLYLAVYAANPGEERYLVPYFFILVLYAIPSAGRCYYIFKHVI